jgi:hypothetical protein
MKKVTKQAKLITVVGIIALICLISRIKLSEEETQFPSNYDLNHVTLPSFVNCQKYFEEINNSERRNWIARFEDELDMIINHVRCRKNFSYIRFGDGEARLMEGDSIVAQKVQNCQHCLYSSLLRRRINGDGVGENLLSETG